MHTEQVCTGKRCREGEVPRGERGLAPQEGVQKERTLPPYEGKGAVGGGKNLERKNKKHGIRKCGMRVKVHPTLSRL